MAQPVGPYELIEKLGSGGMGTVWRAQDTRTGGILALKVLRGELSDNADLVKRFERESGVASRLRHPNIVRAFDAGVDGDVHYMTMELVEGETLFDRIKRERLSEAEARDVGIAVATALEVAHGERVIHRDIKSANILLGPRGVIKVSDFGIARVLDETQRSYTSTFMGSLPYSAPETFDLHVDERSDLYSLGAVLFEAVTGAPPFSATSPLRYMDLHRWEQPDIAAVESAAPSLAPIVAQLLEKEPRRRPPSATAVLDALRGAVVAPSPPAGAPAASPAVTPPLAGERATLVAATPAAPSGVRPPAPPPPRWSGTPEAIGPRDRTRRIVRFAAPALAFVAILAIGGGIYANNLAGGDGGGDGDADDIVVANALTATRQAAALSAEGAPVDPNLVGQFPTSFVVLGAMAPFRAHVSCDLSVGLEGVPSIAESSSLLYQLQEPSQRNDWQTVGYLFNVDIVWLDPAATVIGVTPDVAPGVSGITSPGAIGYAIETNAGGADRLGLDAGVPLAVGDPCDFSSEPAGTAPPPDADTLDPEFARYAPVSMMFGGEPPVIVQARAACSVVDRTEIGLSGVESMPLNAGLLFDNGGEVQVTDWNTGGYQFPIDIVWIEPSDGELTAVSSTFNVAPETFDIAAPGTPAYVLEMNAGVAENLRLTGRAITFVSPCP